MALTDLTTDVPLWLKILATAGVAGAWVWAVVISAARPFCDDRWFRAYVRNCDRVERHMRETMFSGDYTATARRDDKIAAIDRRTDANQDSIAALTAMATQQGLAIKEIPNLSLVIGRLDVTLKNVNGTMSKMESRVEQVADGHNQLVGIIESLRDSIQATRPVRRVRGSASPRGRGPSEVEDA